MWRCHIICSNKFVTCSTIEGKSRRHVLFALQGEPEGGLMLSYNEVTRQYPDHFKISKTHKQQLESLFKERQAVSEHEFRQKVCKHIPDLASKTTTLNWICDAFAFGYYNEQEDFPGVNILTCDDAPEYKLIGRQRSLCWIHDARYYNKLAPFVEHHKKILNEFKDKYWNYYHSLLKYKQAPDAVKRQEMVNKFDELFVSDTGYFDLDKQIKRTHGNKEELLVVLDNPEIPLYNNQSEVYARQQVRKRDICLHTMTRLGTALQDAYMSIIHTCKMHGENPFTYKLDRISGINNYYLPNVVAYAIIH